jgi:hypothetical protein
VLSSIGYVYRQCFDNDEVILGGAQDWMSQWGCGFACEARWRWRGREKKGCLEGCGNRGKLCG